jgi:hypothetical protein
MGGSPTTEQAWPAVNFHSKEKAIPIWFTSRRYSTAVAADGWGRVQYTAPFLNCLFGVISGHEGQRLPQGVL